MSVCVCAYACVCVSVCVCVSRVGSSPVCLVRFADNSRCSIAALGDSPAFGGVRFHVAAIEPDTAGSARAFSVMYDFSCSMLALLEWLQDQWRVSEFW